MRVTLPVMSANDGRDGGKRQQDLVIVDRGALRQLLHAVINTLKASANLARLKEQPQLEAELVDRVGRSVDAAREGLVHGVKQLLISVDELPGVRLQDSLLRRRGPQKPQ